MTAYVLPLGQIGMPQIILIVVVILILFGGRKNTRINGGIRQGNQRV